MLRQISWCDGLIRFAPFSLACSRLPVDVRGNVHCASVADSKYYKSSVVKMVVRKQKMLSMKKKTAFGTNFVVVVVVGILKVK